MDMEETLKGLKCCNRYAVPTSPFANQFLARDTVVFAGQERDQRAPLILLPNCRTLSPGTWLQIHPSQGHL
jgi:hypothetical protein